MSSMPAFELPPPLAENHDDNYDDDVFSQEFLVSDQPETVYVDVSGSGYARQSRFRASSAMSTLYHSVPRLLTLAASQDDCDVAAEHRRLSSWRQTVRWDIGEVSRAKSRRQLMTFSAVGVDRSSLFRGLVKRRSTSSRRSVDGDDGGGRMTSTLQIYTSRQRKDVDEAWRTRVNSRSSWSWRQSLKSLLRGVVRTKSSVDLWATTDAQQQGCSGNDGGAATAGAQKTPVSFRRANSLPRSLKAMKRHSDAASSTKSRSKSVKDELDSTDRSSRSSFRPAVTPAGDRLGRSVSLSRSYCPRRAAMSRVGRPQSMEVHIVALDEFGRPSSTSGSSCGRSAIERRVHVSIPEQPWTKPFANVRLRQHTARVIDSDNYQSSSGRTDRAN